MIVIPIIEPQEIIFIQQQITFIQQQIRQIIIRIIVGILHNVQIISQGRRHQAVEQQIHIPHNIIQIVFIIIQHISHTINGLRRIIIHEVSEILGIIILAAQVTCGAK